jgi:hypothetical protein
LAVPEVPIAVRQPAARYFAAIGANASRQAHRAASNDARSIVPSGKKRRVRLTQPSGTDSSRSET